jgi:hypothetical protein
MTVRRGMNIMKEKMYARTKRVVKLRVKMMMVR